MLDFEVERHQFMYDRPYPQDQRCRCRDCGRGRAPLNCHFRQDEASKRWYFLCGDCDELDRQRRIAAMPVIEGCEHEHRWTGTHLYQHFTRCLDGVCPLCGFKGKYATDLYSHFRDPEGKTWSYYKEEGAAPTACQGNEPEPKQAPVAKKPAPRKRKATSTK